MDGMAGCRAREQAAAAQDVLAAVASLFGTCNAGRGGASRSLVHGRRLVVVSVDAAGISLTFVGMLPQSCLNTVWHQHDRACAVQG